MNREEKSRAQEAKARARAVTGWAFRLPGNNDNPPDYALTHYRAHLAESGACTTCDIVIRFSAGLEEAEDIRIFLNGGPCPEKYRAAYAQARIDLKMGPKDWYEAFAEAAEGIKANGWPTEPMAPELESYCEDAADSIAERPEAERHA